MLFNTNVTPISEYVDWWKPTITIIIVLKSKIIVQVADLGNGAIECQGEGIVLRKSKMQ